MMLHALTSLADASPSPSWMDNLKDYGVLAVLIGLFLWYVWPKMLEDQKLQREAFAKQNYEQRQDFRESLKEISGSVKAMAEASQQLAKNFNEHDTKMLSLHGKEQEAMVTSMNNAIAQGREMIALMRSMHERDDEHKM